jgi:hypothetical protein
MKRRSGDSKGGPLDPVSAVTDVDGHQNQGCFNTVVANSFVRISIISGVHVSY